MIDCGFFFFFFFFFFFAEYDSLWLIIFDFLNLMHWVLLLLLLFLLLLLLFILFEYGFK